MEKAAKRIAYSLILIAYLLMALTVDGVITFSSKMFLGFPTLFIWFYFLGLVIFVSIAILYRFVLTPWADRTDTGAQ